MNTARIGSPSIVRAGSKLATRRPKAVRRGGTASRPRGGRGGVVGVRGARDEGGGGARGVLGLKEAGADEAALGAELHHQGGVRGGGDAARREVDDRQAALLRYVANQVERRAEVLGGRG